MGGARTATPTPNGRTGAVLEVQGLRVSFPLDGVSRAAVDDIELTLVPGSTVALVGESGCGKTTAALSLLGLLEPSASCSSEIFRFAGKPVDDAAAVAALRGTEVAMIFQEPMTALNPVMQIGAQIAEPLVIHRGFSRKQAHRRAIELLAEVGFADPEGRVRSYPHQLSGGMRQRVMIAMALACEPRVLIADEPTTALDVTVQAQILVLLRALQRERGLAMLFITHDLTLLPIIADEVAVMYAGRIVERLSVQSFIRGPRHPYARALLDAAPHPGRVPHAIAGAVPSLGNRPAGCAFHPRCDRATSACIDAVPPLIDGLACENPFAALQVYAND